MFRWPYGGRKVYIIGSFNNWSEKIPMSYNSEEEAFVVILNVSVGKHFYRFIVDGEYTTDLNSPTEKDEHGYLSNVVDITADEESEEAEEEEEEDEDDDISSSSSSSHHHHTTSAPIGIGKAHDNISAVKSHATGVPASSPPRRANTSAPNPYGVSTYQSSHTQSHQTSPTHHHIDTHHHQSPTVKQHHSPPTSPQHNSRNDHKHEKGDTSPTKEGESKQYSNTYGYQEEIFPENKKNPPILPPHLRYTPLNSSKKFHHNPGLLPIPLHVTVNHAYFSERDNMNKVGVTQRYKDKFTTVVLYKPKHTELKKYQNITTN
ncbi:hypothetical protein C9374_001971 [Naegleria lovaniensis]|uniref:Association with the SNF1 complex (ASC) domain-containing protein n=1 Tax=Naegleria lovaniensis TaxID=51637 RepID=A0AA88KMW6_NAELO|nr:uncharacterized protein C9374_001971 [Naegleria lovaniensis]KAG2386936.1 hypothetical protein C9374_001971 [Naegleria lovaniensis]